MNVRGSSTVAIVSLSSRRERLYPIRARRRRCYRGTAAPGGRRPGRRRPLREAAGGERCATVEHVGRARRPLLAAGEDDLRADVRRVGMQALEQLGPLGGEGDDPVRPRSVEVGEMGGDGLLESASARTSRAATLPASVAPGSGTGRRSSRPSPRVGARRSSASRAMCRYVVSLPPATVSMPPRPTRIAVSRRASTVEPSLGGSTRSPA